MSEESNLGDLTKLMLFFGRISEVHLKNLKSYPFIFFNDVSKVSLDYVVATKKEEGDESIISYDLSIDKENGSLDVRYKALESAVRSIFWKEMKVQISINGKEVYKSE